MHNCALFNRKCIRGIMMDGWLIINWHCTRMMTLCSCFCQNVGTALISDDFLITFTSSLFQNKMYCNHEEERQVFAHILHIVFKSADWMSPSNSTTFQENCSDCANQWESQQGRNGRKWRIEGGIMEGRRKDWSDMDWTKILFSFGLKLLWLMTYWSLCHVIVHLMLISLILH